jgi:hypothetical protein
MPIFFIAASPNLVEQLSSVKERGKKKEVKIKDSRNYSCVQRVLAIGNVQTDNFMQDAVLVTL